jgi:TolB-like protein/DNA-binding winged helix-turn-helix (wHTH) protein/lipoprotein NlpI
MRLELLKWPIRLAKMPVQTTDLLPYILRGWKLAAMALRSPQGSHQNFSKLLKPWFMPAALNNSYEFDEFWLDEQHRALFRGQQAVALSPKAFEALLVLVQNRGRLMTKDELMKALWPDSFVEESNLTQTIFVLRKALGETPNKRYIITVPGRGYRFAADVRVVGPNQQRDVELVSPSDVRSSAEKSFPQRRRLVLVSALLLLAILVGVYVQRSRSRIRAHPPSEKVMLAVLPFENLTGDAGQEYFSDGLTEEMISHLGNLNPQRLGVIARTSVMHYKNSRGQLDRIARELNVHYVLEGSVRREVGMVRISAQLIHVKDQTHVWARQYDRELSSLLAVQAEIAQQIAEQIQLTLGDETLRVADARSLTPEGYQAYDLYLKGRYFWNKRTPDGFKQAVVYFQQAVSKDPDYARAHAGLADAYALMSNYGHGPVKELMPKARAAAQRALALNERLAEAHTSLALIAESYDWDWQTAEREFRRAIELDPNYATAHHWYGEFLAFQGRFDESFAEIERARLLDPLSLIITTDYGVILYFARQYDRAIEQFRAVQSVEPNFARAHVIIAAYIEKRMFVEALVEVENWRRLDPDSPWSWGAAAHVFAYMSRRAEVQRALQKLAQAGGKPQLENPALLVPIYAGLKDKDKVLESLEKAYRERTNTLTDLKVNPTYDFLRSDPRFHDLMRSVRLTQ